MTTTKVSRPTQTVCLQRALDLLEDLYTHNASYNGCGFSSYDVDPNIIALAQVWATLATVPR